MRSILLMSVCFGIVACQKKADDATKQPAVSAKKGQLTQRVLTRQDTTDYLKKSLQDNYVKFGFTQYQIYELKVDGCLVRSELQTTAS